MLRNIERQNKWGSVEGQFRNVQFRSGSRKVKLGKGERFETDSRVNLNQESRSNHI